jgi:hypothetical protein
LGTPLELIQMPVSVEIRLLHGILGFRVILENCPRGSIEALVVVPHEDPEHLDIRSGNPMHDLFKAGPPWLSQNVMILPL